MPADASPGRARRLFLKRLLAACGAAGLVSFAGCRAGEEPARPDGDVQTPTGREPAPGLSAQVADCQSTETLSPQALDVRKALDYMPETPRPKERCDDCRFYEPPARKGACGGCEHFAGPVTGGGWCLVWVEQLS